MPCSTSLPVCPFYLYFVLTTLPARYAFELSITQ